MGLEKFPARNLQGPAASPASTGAGNDLSTTGQAIPGVETWTPDRALPAALPDGEGKKAQEGPWEALSVREVFRQQGPDGTPTHTPSPLPGQKRDLCTLHVSLGVRGWV